ncbi:unnamed protein product, partial [Symbiodinium natans]
MEQVAVPNALPQLTSSISKLARLSRWKQAVDVARRAEATGLRLDTVAATALLSGAVRAPWGKATLCFQRLWKLGPEPDVAMLNVIVSARARSSKWQEAFALMWCSGACGVAISCRTVVSALKAPWLHSTALLAAPGIPINTVVLNAAVAAGAQRLGDFKKRKLEPDVVSFNTAADVSAKLGQWEETAWLLQHLQEQGLDLDQVSINTMLASCTTWRTSLSIMQSARQAAIRTDVVSCASCMAACERPGRWAEAMAKSAQLRDCGIRCDSVCRNTAVSACCKADRWAWAVQLFAGMPEQTLGPGELAASAGLAAAARRRAWRSGLALLGDLRFCGQGAAGCADAVAYTAMLLACMKSSKIRAVAKLLEDMKALRLEIGRAAQNVALALHEVRGLWRSALQLLRTMQRKCIQTDLAATVAAVGSCGKTAAWQAAVEVATSLSRGQLRPDVAVCDSLTVPVAVFYWLLGDAFRLWLLGQASTLSGGLRYRRAGRMSVWTASITNAGRAKSWQKAVALLEEGISQRLPLNTIVSNAAMAACEKAKQWKAVLALLSSLGSDTVGWNSALSACEKSGSWQVALGLYDELPSRRLQPDGMTFGLLIRVAQVAGGWEAALNALSDMREASFKPNVMNYAVVLRGCKDVGSWQPALALLSTMMAEGVRPDVLAVNTAMAACAEQGCWEVAVGLLALMRSELLTPSTASANVVMKTCGQCAAWPVVLLLMGALQAGLGEGRDAVSYGTALTAYGRARRSDLISELLDEVERLDVRLTEVSFTAALAVASWMHVLQLLARMSRQALQPGAQHLTAAMFSCIEDGAWRRAIRLAENGALQQNSFALAALLQASRAGRQWASTLDLLRDSGIEPNTVTVTEAARAFDSHSWPFSISLISAARSQGIQANEAGHNIVARTLSFAGLWQHGLSLAAAAGSWDQSLALLSAATLRRASPSGCARAWEQPGPWPWTMAYLAQMVHDPLEVLETSQRCLKAFARAGDFEALRKVLEQMRALHVEPDVVPAFLALSAFANSGAWRDAAALLRAVAGAQVQVQLVAQHRLIGAMHSAGKWQEVVTSLDGIKRLGYLPDIFSYGLLLAARDPGSRAWPSAVRLLDMVLKESLEVSQVALGAASQRAERAHHWTLALHFCNGMQFQNLASTRGFSSAISACENLSQWLTASTLLRQMAGAHVRRDMVLRNAAAAASGGAGRWEEALRTLNSGVLHDKSACGTGLSACGRMRAWQASLQLMTSAAQNQVQVDMPSCSVVVSCCEHALHTIGAVGLLEWCNDAEPLRRHDRQNWHGAADATLEVAVAAVSGPASEEAPKLLSAALRALGALAPALRSEALGTASLELACRVLASSSVPRALEPCQTQALQLLRSLAKSSAELLGGKQGLVAAVAAAFAAAKDAAPAVDDLDEVSSTAQSGRECLRALARRAPDDVLPAILEAAQKAAQSADALDRAAAVHAVAFALSGAQEAPAGWATPLVRSLGDGAVWVRQAACEGAVMLAEELKPSASATEGFLLLLQALSALFPREPQPDLLEKAALAVAALVQELSSDEAAPVLSSVAPALIQALTKVSRGALTAAASAAAATDVGSRQEATDATTASAAAAAAVARALRALAAATADMFAPFAPEAAQSLVSILRTASVSAGPGAVGSGPSPLLTPAVLAACLDAAGAVIASAWADPSFRAEKEELASTASSVLMDARAPSEAKAAAHSFYAQMALARFEEFAPTLDTVLPFALEAMRAAESGEVVKHGRRRAVRTGSHEERLAATEAVGTYVAAVGARFAPHLPSALPAVCAQAKHADPGVRAETANALAKMGRVLGDLAGGLPEGHADRQAASSLAEAVARGLCDILSEAGSSPLRCTLQAKE